MTETSKKDKSFIEALEEISKRVEKMPEWKKEGWAILEEESYYCGSTEEFQNEKRYLDFSDYPNKMVA